MLTYEHLKNKRMNRYLKKQKMKNLPVDIALDEDFRRVWEIAETFQLRNSDLFEEKINDTELRKFIGKSQRNLGRSVILMVEFFGRVPNAKNARNFQQLIETVRQILPPIPENPAQEENAPVVENDPVVENAPVVERDLEAETVPEGENAPVVERDLVAESVPEAASVPEGENTPVVERDLVAESVPEAASVREGENEDEDALDFTSAPDIFNSTLLTAGNTPIFLPDMTFLDSRIHPSPSGWSVTVDWDPERVKTLCRELLAYPRFQRRVTKLEQPRNLQSELESKPLDANYDVGRCGLLFDLSLSRGERIGDPRVIIKLTKSFIIFTCHFHVQTFLVLHLKRMI
ncbi:Oidioi.mRNA.OKI2018_I69.YSR.g17154.t1.cds [Oikopleura dioica]|uniref:Oidioi.mRNA.OKI2018_I69.YSR.g17154.t1.cds n=1 Tax=Oikopleura dioica TaxID=34765 RepID=A0ABN7SIB7_OIKDI|nr:Oidioi.mRNA.OKI2018_I69.YSR.g17154.t1.cds [Oikopleura dioica]